MLDENNEKTIGSSNVNSLNSYKKEKIFLSIYLVFAILSAFLLGIFFDKYLKIEEFKSNVCYREFN